MNNTILTILFLTFFNSQDIFSQVRKFLLPEEFYYGHKFPYSVFIKSEQDCLILELFYIDKRPRAYFCDTLFLKGNSHFEGEFTKINLHSNRYFLSFSKDQFSAKKIRIQNNILKYKNLPEMKRDFATYQKEHRD